MSRHTEPNDPRDVLLALHAAEVDNAATRDAVSRAREGLARQTESVPTRGGMKRWLLRVSAAAAVVALTLGLWPMAEPPQMAWADIVHHLHAARSAETLYLHLHQTLEEGRSIEAEAWAQTPDKARQTLPVGDSDERITMILNGERVCVMLEQAGLYIVQPYARDGVANLFAVIDNAMNERAELEYVPGDRGAKRRVHGYRQIATPDDQSRITFWFDADGATLVGLTTEIRDGDEWSTRAEAEIVVNPQLDPALFDVAPPAGYRLVSEAGFNPAMSDEVRDVLEAVEAGRDRIDTYRMVYWRSQSENEPHKDKFAMGRALRRGEQWRVDAVYHTVSLDDSPPFDAVWDKLKPNTKLGAKTLMTCDAIVYEIANQRNDAGKLEPRIRRGDNTNLSRMRLEQLGWPTWPSPAAVGLPDLGNYSYRLLPASDAYPGLVGVQVEVRGPQPTLKRYWLDPDNGWISRVTESYQRLGEPWRDDPDWRPDEPVVDGDPPEGRWWLDQRMEVVEVAHTPDGAPYPLRVRKRVWLVPVEDAHSRYARPPHVIEIQLTTDLGDAAGLLDWPADLPDPHDYAR
jgi:hypothetical protein